MITSRKRKDMRRFYENGEEIAFYTLRKDIISHARANIHNTSGYFEHDVDSLGVSLTDYEEMTIRRIRLFLRKFLKKELVSAILEHLYDDLRLISYENTKKLIFT